ncbi:Inosine guanosine and xanthosine phosphorylase [Rhodopirellula maiorica SM1]|uniref:Purine nucleoside phosphorylase n=2 Tax=Novipirellula TaxID=2795426 RepID=M5RN19_9BACT|nr:Inosine guanosine and xanthosine phosphorylase [Rhodopirellula maiorica SM1]
MIFWGNRMQQNLSMDVHSTANRYLDHIDQAAEFLRRQSDRVPTVAIILGSGLGGLAEKIQHPVVIPFPDIPGFAASTASGHRGQLILGELEQTRVVAMAGRFHRYEGWSRAEVSFPVFVMARLGATQLVVSNAAGGVNPKLNVGDIVVIRDHIDFMRGEFQPPNLTPQGSGLPEGTFGFSPLRHRDVYDPELSSIAMQASREHNFAAYEGTYLATLGPNYETRAEYRMMRRIGADVAGMSTVPEVLAAANLGMRTLGLSMVSNVANPDSAVVASHDEVLAAGLAAEGKMEAIVRAVLRKTSSHSK